MASPRGDDQPTCPARLKHQGIWKASDRGGIPNPTTGSRYLLAVELVSDPSEGQSVAAVGHDPGANGVRQVLGSSPSLPIIFWSERPTAHRHRVPGCGPTSAGCWNAISATVGRNHTGSEIMRVSTVPSLRPDAVPSSAPVAPAAQSPASHKSRDRELPRGPGEPRPPPGE